MLSQFHSLLSKLGRISLNQFHQNTKEISDVDEKTESIFLYFNMLVSLWSISAKADGKLDPPEEKVIEQLLQEIFFLPHGENEALLSDELLKRLKTKKSELINLFYHYFKHPLTLNNISHFAKERKLSDFFCSQAAIIISANKEVAPDERNFMNQLGESLEISESKRKKLESQSVTDLEQYQK